MKFDYIIVGAGSAGCVLANKLSSSQKNKVAVYSKKKITNEMNYIDYGLGILSKEHFNSFNKTRSFDLSEIYENLSKRSKLLGFEIKNRFYEIGSHNGIKDLKNYLNKFKN